MKTSGQTLETKAFTLLELLMVVGIIALLAALLFPALLGARARARSAACQNNMRQVGLSMAMYVADHHRYPPMLVNEAGRFQSWPDRLAQYASVTWTNRTWHCPAYIADNGVIRVERQPIFTSYSYNAYGIAGGADGEQFAQSRFGYQPFVLTSLGAGSEGAK